MTSKELTLQGDTHTWHVVVHQMTLRMATILEKLTAEAALNPVENASERVYREFFYPVIACCTTCQAGPIPTVDEFLDLPVNVSNEWYLVVHELNPEALPDVLGGAIGEQSEEKKEPSPMINMPGSETS